jgi:transposase
VSFSCCAATREDAWDRTAIVRGFWGCPDSAWSEWTGREQRPRVGFGFTLSAAAPAGIRVVAVAGERVACGRRDRTWDDLPWAAHSVTLVYRQRRVDCRRCGIRTERIEFADPKARVTRRLRQQIAVDCQSMPTSHAAVRHGVSWGKARRAEKACLAEWDRTRVKHRPRHLGIDEIQRGKGQHFWTVLSDLVRGEVIGLQKDRSEDSLRTLLNDRLDAQQRAAVEAVCTDMHREGCTNSDPA